MLMLFSIMKREWKKNADGCSRKSVTKVSIYLSIYLSITVGLQWKKGWWHYWLAGIASSLSLSLGVLGHMCSTASSLSTLKSTIVSLTSMIGKEKTSIEKIASAIDWHQPVAESFNNWVHECSARLFLWCTCFTIPGWQLWNLVSDACTRYWSTMLSHTVEIIVGHWNQCENSIQMMYAYKFGR